jgi:hypothetical protein
LGIPRTSVVGAVNNRVILIELFSPPTEAVMGIVAGTPTVFFMRIPSSLIYSRP